ncbi:MAG: PhoU domain-containing protein, partial [Candidatus Bathyarchaeia archaeon]
MNSCEDVNSFEKICSELVEMKDTSELMMDLAYSSLLLNSRELAEEVLQLEEKVDKMHTDFELSVLSRCAVEGDIKGLMALLRMGSTMERIADAAVEIAEVVLKGIEPHPILRIVIEAADETVERGVLSRHSALVGKS